MVVDLCQTAKSAPKTQHIQAIRIVRPRECLHQVFTKPGFLKPGMYSILSEEWSYILFSLYNENSALQGCGQREYPQVSKSL